MEEIIIISDTGGMRLDAYLSLKIDKCSRSYIQKLITDSLVTVNGENTKSNYKIKPGDVVCVKKPILQEVEVKPEETKLDIIYEDDFIIVVNKPKGMVVHPAAGNYTGTLVNALMKHCEGSLSDISGAERPGIVHRIDKDTSGILVVAKDNKAHEELSMKLKEHKIKRIYEAVVCGIISEEMGKIDAPIGRHPVDRKKMSVNLKGGRRAVTRFRVLERFKQATYVELELETGRTHQIRVHMSYIGFPLVGDNVYGSKKQKYGIKGQVLHARKLAFNHPITNDYMEFEAPLPDYFEDLLIKLRKEVLTGG